MPAATPESWQSALGELAQSLRLENPSSCRTIGELEDFRVRFLGRKGRLTELLKALKDFPLEKRKQLGPKAQTLQKELEENIALRRLELTAELEISAAADLPDLSLPAVPQARGCPHPLTQTMREMTRILVRMGFAQADGPLLESERYNFEALNIPQHHPARDMQDTFYLKNSDLLMRTHTSSVQVRTLEKLPPPLRIFSAGRVFRRDAVDATHSAAFHQVEGLAVDKDLSMADLKGTLEIFLKNLLGPETRLRFRPSYFPFTEPSAEVDVGCLFCRSAGCSVCKRTGFIEMLGAGRVHPKVLESAGLDPREWSGFAFGIGVERVAMLRLGVSDIRLFYENDQRFLRQFDENLA